MQSSVGELLKYLDDARSVVLTHSLEDKEKEAILTELVRSVPAEAFCRASSETRNIIIYKLQGYIDGCTKKTKSKSSTEEGQRTSSVESPKEELLRNPDGNTGGTRAKKAVVNKAAKKSRATKRSA